MKQVEVNTHVLLTVAITIRVMRRCFLSSCFGSFIFYSLISATLLEAQ